VIIHTGQGDDLGLSPRVKHLGYHPTKTINKRLNVVLLNPLGQLEAISQHHGMTCGFKAFNGNYVNGPKATQGCCPTFNSSW